MGLPEHNSATLAENDKSFWWMIAFMIAALGCVALGATTYVLNWQVGSLRDQLAAKPREIEKIVEVPKIFEVPKEVIRVVVPAEGSIEIIKGLKANTDESLGVIKFFEEPKTVPIPKEILQLPDRTKIIENIKADVAKLFKLTEPEMDKVLLREEEQFTQQELQKGSSMKAQLYLFKYQLYYNTKQLKESQKRRQAMDQLKRNPHRNEKPLVGIENLSVRVEILSDAPPTLNKASITKKAELKLISLGIPVKGIEDAAETLDIWINKSEEADKAYELNLTMSAVLIKELNNGNFAKVYATLWERSETVYTDDGSQGFDTKMNKLLMQFALDYFKANGGKKPVPETK